MGEKKEKRIRETVDERLEETEIQRMREMWPETIK